jgi:tetratricopeptide (TPR) repeat protein
MGSEVCLEEDAAAAFAEARLPAASMERAGAHLRECATCRERVAAVVIASRASRTAVTEILGPTPVRGESGTEPIGGPRRPRPAPRPALAAGVSIGRYTVLGLVGRGGMGEVYAAFDPSLDRKVALKLMLAEVSATDDFAQERLLREAQAIAKLSHPNVVVVYDVGTFAGRVFVAMEFVEGATLAAWLLEKERPWREIVAAFVQAARGLSAAHRAGIVHRDFKPQNVMVTADGTIRVMDFGLARRIGERGLEDGVVPAAAPSATGEDPALTRVGERLGTPLYMAPEQFAGGTIDARTDQFSFCVALYWALHGVHPFGGVPSVGAAGSAASVGAAKARAVPPWLQRVVTRGLGVEPSSRWPSMDELAAALVRDPGRRRGRALAAALTVAGCVAIGVASARAIDGRRALCAGGPARIAAIWETGDAGARAGSRREALHAAILAAGGAEGPKRWTHIAGLLDRRATSWVEAYRDACEDTNVRHEQSAEAMDLRMSCLADSLDATRALTALLAGADPLVLEHATASLGSLDDVQRCADLRQLSSGPAPPQDPSTRKRVEELRARLREADALFQVGAYRRAGEAARAVQREAAPLHYCPLEAEAMVLEGDAGLEALDKDPDDSLGTLEAAIERAESCGHDRVVARAATELVWGHGFHDPAAAERFASLARGAIARLGGDSRLESWLANNMAAMLFDQGRWQEAKVWAERAVAIKERTVGPDHVDTAISLTVQAGVYEELEQPEEALKLVDRALAIEERWVGPDSGLFLVSTGDRAEFLDKLGRSAEAEDLLRRVVSKIGPPWQGLAAGRALSVFSAVLIHRGRSAEAVPYLEEALRQQAKDTPFEVARTRFELAQARDEIAPGDSKAVELASQALAAYSSTPSLEHRRAEVAAWLAAHQPTRRAARSSAARKLSGRAFPVPAMSKAVP